MVEERPSGMPPSRERLRIGSDGAASIPRVAAATPEVLSGGSGD